MAGLILKHLLSNEYGPFDRFVELGVFALIAYEVVVGIVRHRKTAKRQKELDEIVKTLSEFMKRGQQLERTIPEPGHDRMINALSPTIAGWTNAVKAWSKETGEFLERHSPKAAAAFMLISGIGIFANPQIVYPESGHSFPIEGTQRESYQKLIVQFGNLRNEARCLLLVRKLAKHRILKNSMP